MAKFHWPNICFDFVIEQGSLTFTRTLTYLYIGASPLVSLDLRHLNSKAQHHH